MEVCGSCQRPRTQGLSFCTGCGRRFADPVVTEPGPRRKHRPDARRVWLRPAIAFTGAAAIVAGVVIGLLLSRHPSAAAPRAFSSRVSQSPHNQQTAGSAPSPTYPASSSAPANAGPVAITAAAESNPAADSVAAFLGQYFTAINGRDYQAYDALLSSAAQVTSQQFASGYQSTKDSSETLTGISTAANGDMVAAVTFVSHQRSADSAGGTGTCTDWDISLYLTQSGGGYLIDQPPPGYQATYSSCL